jgi:hypothetical protein
MRFLRPREQSSTLHHAHGTGNGPELMVVHFVEEGAGCFSARAAWRAAIRRENDYGIVR